MTQHIPEHDDDPIENWIRKLNEETPMTPYVPRITGTQKLAMALIAIALLVCIGMSAAHAQTACTVGGQTTCLVASKTEGETPLATTLTWNVVGATSCAAGGAGTAAAWSGAVPVSGTRNMSGIMGKLTLTLDCVAPATAGKMRLSWTPPTQNTDGTPLTNLGGYIVSYGASASALNQTVSLAVPGASAYDLTGLTAGTWFASLQAATTACFPTSTVDCHVSLPSSTVSKAVTTTPGGALPQLTLVITPYQVPKPPTNVVATDVTAFAIDTNADGTLVATRVDLVPLSTSCAEDRCTVLTRRAP